MVHINGPNPKDVETIESKRDITNDAFERFLDHVENGHVENVAERSAISTLFAILGRTAIYEKRAGNLERRIRQRMKCRICSSFGAMLCERCARKTSTLRIIVFGAHPDDCDIRAAGTAAKLAEMGHKVKFVAVTNGDAGHQSEGGGALAKRRRAEAMESARRLGIEYEVLDNHDGELLPTLDVRRQIIRQIRLWNADS